MNAPDLLCTFACLLIVAGVCGVLYVLGTPPRQKLYGSDDDGPYIVIPKGDEQPERWRDEDGDWWASVAMRADGSREYRMDRRVSRAYF